VGECGFAKPRDRERTFRFILRNLAKWERK